MFDPFLEAREAIEAAIRAALPTAVGEVPTTYPDPAHGDIASPIALSLAKSLGQPPRKIAESLQRALEALPGITRVDVAGPGFLNVHIDRRAALRRMLGDLPATPVKTGKVIVEHTNINPNKAAHIGHLRNAVLGDTLVRCLRALGHQVEVQNYIDDTGVQVADAVVALRQLAGLDLTGVQALIDSCNARVQAGGHGFDYDLWDLYARVTDWFAAEPTREEHRRQVLAELEHGEGTGTEIGRALSREIVRCHLRTMQRLGIRYDLLPKESDILAHRFWQQAFARLRQTGAIIESHEGKTAGCWVMNLPHSEEETGGQEYEKVIVRSNGVVTYVGKDIAYQLWKFGLLGRDFEYAPFTAFRYDGDSVLYETVAPGRGHGAAPAFGRAQIVYNVIDVRQAYLQRVVKQGLERLGHTQEAAHSIHFAYEMVALSPATARELRPDLSLTEEEQARPWIDMSGRRGLGVKADDLIDQLILRATQEVESRAVELGPQDRRQIAEQIAIGALRYYMLRFGRNKIVAFDMNAALAFEGETGPYAQYASVRIARIVAKLAERSGQTISDVRKTASQADFTAIPADLAQEHWRLVHHAARLSEAVRQAVETLEFAVLAKYSFELAQAISGFYHRFPVLKEENLAIQQARLATLLVAERALNASLGLMGVPVPERM
jgi:arginyl-tRNA synthetase